jgi:acyl-CoA synthetase (NDP forming)
VICKRWSSDNPPLRDFLHYRGAWYGGQYATALLQTLFEPRSVALVCENLQPGSSAALALAQLEAGGFGGELLIVCAGENCDASLRSYPDFAAVGRVVDLAVLVLPTARIAAQLRACAEQGCRAVVLLAPDGGEREQRRPGMTAEIVDVARTHDIALLGPDSLGCDSPVRWSQRDDCAQPGAAG